MKKESREHAGREVKSQTNQMVFAKSVPVKGHDHRTFPKNSAPVPIKSHEAIYDINRAAAAGGKFVSGPPVREDGVIQSKPLPLKSHQGERILARSADHYNCASPNREEVFYNNYARRKVQLEGQGYYSKNYKPYQLLGGPLCLDDKQLILSALGQLKQEFSPEAIKVKKENGATLAEPSKDEQKDEGKKDGSGDPPKPYKFVVRRNNKNQKSLHKEVATGRYMVQWAKLGHGVFNMLREHDETRVNAQHNERLRKEEQRKKEWQPAVVAMSDDDGETDEELEKEENLSEYMTQRPESRKEVTFAFDDLSTQRDAQSELPSTTAATLAPPNTSFGGTTPSKSLLSGASSPTKRRRSKRINEPPRPYTPCHSNINIDPDGDEIDLRAIFRQMCAVNWILESMMIEPPAAMEPISKCWNIYRFSDLEQRTFCKTTVQKLRKDKTLDSRWNAFISAEGAGHLRTRTSTRGLLSTQNSGFKGSMRRLSANSTVNRAFSAMGSVDLPSTPKNEDARSFAEAADKLGDIPDSVSVGRQEELRGETPKHRSPSTLSERSVTPMSRISGKSSLSNKLSKQDLEEKDKLEKPRERQVSTWVASTNRKLHRAKSAPTRNGDPTGGSPEFKPMFPSSKHLHLAAELRTRFADVTEDQALMLHDKLEALEKKRLERSENKFQSIRTNIHISSQLALLKEAGQDKDELLAEENKRKKKLEDESKWYQELVRNLPAEVNQHLPCLAILDKLQSLGKIESRKATPQKFTNVLSGLRHWELCSPDISAAIEFVREKVVGMAVEEFEAWYQAEMPNVMRSKSAPPTAM